MLCAFAYFVVADFIPPITVDRYPRLSDIFFIFGSRLGALPDVCSPAGAHGRALSGRLGFLRMDSVRVWTRYIVLGLARVRIVAFRQP